MLEFSIPDCPATYSLNKLLIQLLKERKYLFYDDFKISSVYGTFAGCTWNGGRDLLGILDEKSCNEILRFYNDNGISYRYTFTNKYIEERDLFDRYCNMLLRVNNKDNGITYNQQLLKDYVCEHYPSYYFVSSCTRNIKDIDVINKMSLNELLVLDFRLNNTSTIKELSHPNNIEIIANEQCMACCPYRELHYSTIAKNNMFLTDKVFSFNKLCYLKNGTYDEFIKNKPQYVSRELIYKIYLPLGINKFKLVGRHQHLPDLALMGYLDYFVKDEYKNEFIKICKKEGII